MEIDRQETIPSASEGDSVCLICLRLYSDENNSTETTKLLHFQNVFDIVSKYLCADIFANCFKWDFVQEGMSPVCSACFTSMEKIFKIKEQVDKLQNAIQYLVKSFTSEVINHHSKLEFEYTKKNEQPSTSKIEIKVEQSDNESHSNDEESNFRNGHKDSLKEALEFAKNPQVQKNDSPWSMTILNGPKKHSKDTTSCSKLSDVTDVTKYEKFSLKPLRIVISRSSISDTSTSGVTVSNGKIIPNVKPLRITLTRLKFDTKGKVLLPIDTHYKKRPITIKTLKGIVKSGHKAHKNVYKNGSSKVKRIVPETGVTNGDNSEDESNDESTHERKSFKLSIAKYHNVSKRFQCQHKSCQLAFNFSKEIEVHSLKSGHVNTKKYKCKECKKPYFRYLDLKLHKKLHLKNKTLKCKICNRKISENRSRFHNYRLHSERKFKCKICGIRFLRKVNYKNHLKIHDKKPIRCKKCYKKFQWRLSYKKHRCKRNSENNYKCEFCSKLFWNRLSFNRHCLSHLKRKIRKLISCIACKKFHFGSRIKDKCIIRHFRGGTTKEFICEVCESVFKNSKRLDIHSVENRHVNKKHFFCAVCRKPFYKPTDLEEHLTTHKDGEPISQFKKTNDLSRRISNENLNKKIHKDTTKENCCRICGKKFKYKHNLDDHLNTHSGEKPHKCKICKKRFQQRNELFKHSKYCCP